MVIRVRDGAADDPHLVDDRGCLSRREVNTLLNRTVHGLRALGLGPDRPAAVFASNAAEAALAHVGGLLAGVASVPVNPMLGRAEVAYLLRDSGAGVLLVGPETAAVGVAAAADSGVPHVVGWRCDGHDDLVARVRWLAEQSADEPAADVASADILFYTSGTTGHPKGTTSRLSSVPRTVDDLVGLWLAHLPTQIGPSLRPTLVVGPMHHIAPLSSAIVGVLGHGAVVLPRFDATEVVRAIERYRPGSMVMVPTHFSRLLALPAEVREGADVSSIEWVGLTGASCPVELKRRMIEWMGPVVLEAYGGTEAGVVCLIDSKEWLDHPGSVGTCIPDFEPVVVGEDDAVLSPGEVGRLYFRDLTGRGIEYRNAPDKTAAAHLAPGVFTLGDVGYVDPDGYVYITDRAVDMIVSGGVNIYPAEAEAVLVQHPAVRDVAVIGVPHPDLGEAVRALVEPADADAPPDADELIRYCRQRLAHYKCPTSVELVVSVGRSAMGKLDKRALRAPYWPTERTIGG